MSVNSPDFRSSVGMLSLSLGLLQFYIPFHQHKITNSVYPLKTFEGYWLKYFAVSSGSPTISPFLTAFSICRICIRDFTLVVGFIINNSQGLVSVFDNSLVGECLNHCIVYGFYWLVYLQFQYYYPLFSYSLSAKSHLAFS